MFVRADHVALSVRDMEGAIAFYRDVIGMDVVFDREFGAPMARLIGEPGTQVRIVHMKLADSVVELFDYRHPQGRDPQPDARQSDYGLTHIGFIVEDFWATYERLVAEDLRWLWKNKYGPILSPAVKTVPSVGFLHRAVRRFGETVLRRRNALSRPVLLEAIIQSECERWALLEILRSMHEDTWDAP